MAEAIEQFFVKPDGTPTLVSGMWRKRMSGPGYIAAASNDRWEKSGLPEMAEP